MTVAIRSLVALASVLFASLTVFAQVTPQPDETATENRDIVVLRALDKITARINEIELPLETETKFGTLIISAKYCRTRPPIETPETFAYLEIDNVKRGGDRDRVFEGWMVASSPALNALEHAVYDVWVIDCKIAEPEAPTSSR